jgi:hypothetical protein
MKWRRFGMKRLWSDQGAILKRLKDPSTKIWSDRGSYGCSFYAAVISNGFVAVCADDVESFVFCA